jgi:hypothetical protein
MFSPEKNSAEELLSEEIILHEVHDIVATGTGIIAGSNNNAIGGILWVTTHRLLFHYSSKSSVCKCKTASSTDMVRVLI